jgi:hypothetical protein
MWAGMGLLAAAPDGDEVLQDAVVGKRLESEGFVVTNMSYRQGFSANLTGKPAFITSNVSMGAWAEYRHAVAISQTTNIHYGALIRTDPGYVEPVPDFFGTMAKAAERLAGDSLQNQELQNRFRAYRFALELAGCATCLKAGAIVRNSGAPRWQLFEERMDGLFDKVRGINLTWRNGISVRSGIANS